MRSSGLICSYFGSTDAIKQRDFVGMMLYLEYVVFCSYLTCNDTERIPLSCGKVSNSFLQVVAVFSMFYGFCDGIYIKLRSQLIAFAFYCNVACYKLIYKWECWNVQRKKIYSVVLSLLYSVGVNFLYYSFNVFLALLCVKV